MSVRLEEMLAQLKEMPAQHRTRIEQEALAATAALPWVPNPGPQSAAYYSLADEVYYGGEAGGGKLLALDTPLPTPTGWATMGEVAVGDALIDEHGEPCRVVAKSAVTFEPTYRMTFSDGSAIVAGARHQWVTSTLRERLRLWACSPERRALRRAARPLRGLGRRPDLSERNSRAARDQRLPTRGARTSAEIAATLRLGGMINHSVDLCGPLRLPDAPLLVDPYVLGAWLGDGTSATGAINAADEPILAEVASAGYAVRAQAGPYAHGVLGLKRQLRTLGVIGNKHIPVPYLRGSVEQRLALLQGLMDTDGYCDQRGQCEITLCRRQLVEGVEELLYSLGVKACLRESRATLNGRDVGPRWRLKFLTALAAFRLPRKLIRQKRHGFRGTHARRYIVAAEQIEPVPMQCVQVDSPSRMYLCGRQMVPTHNSDLLVGLAINRHTRATIFREFKDDARELGRRMCAILGGTAGWNDQQARFHGRGKEIIFDGLPNEEDKQHHKGKARDFHGFDEISDYTESQYEFIIAWNRSANPLQRCRVVVTGNPPTRAKGLWVIKRWAAWLDPRHPHPAKDGELRWYLRTEDGQEEEVEGRGPFAVDGRETYAKSRTFIRARLADNPDLARSDYDATLARLPKELQDAYRKGRFDVALQDHAFQVIPTGWILEAQKRWTPRPPRGVPMCGMGVDPANGGAARFTIATRYDNWLAPLVCIPGIEIKLQSQGAGHVVAHRKDNADVMIDMGGGYGGGTYERLLENRIAVLTHLGSKATAARTADRKLGFGNKRAEVYWRFREALDPDQDGGSPVALPPDPELVSDLTVLTYEVRRAQIHVLEKDEVVKVLGRSPDKGDAVVLAWAAGPKGLVPHLTTEYGPEQYIAPARMYPARPKVDLGPRHRSRS